MISLSIKEKIHKLSTLDAEDRKIDILKILAYIKHHLSEKGYAIFGDFF